MSFLIKQAINDLSSETSDIQVVLSQKADIAQTYSKFSTYSTAEVDKKFTDLIDSAPETLNTLKELSKALNDDNDFAGTVTKSLASKAPLDSPTFTGTIGGVSKAAVGLGSVDNTTDANKPVSTPTQTALNAKANIINPTFTAGGSFITGPTSPVSIINSSGTPSATFADNTITIGRDTVYQGAITSSGSIIAIGALSGSAFDNLLKPYALTATISGAYQPLLSVVKSPSSPLSLANNILTIDLLPVATYVQNTGVFQKAITVTVSSLSPLVWNSATNTLAIDLSAYYRTNEGLFSTLYASGSGTSWIAIDGSYRFE